MKIKQSQFNNGLRWAAIKIPGVLSVTSLLSIEAGPRFDPPGKNGLSHFMEHMVFRGSAKWPTRRQTARELEKRGMRDAAFSYGETNKYWIKSGKAEVGLAIKSLIDRVKDPLLREEDIEEEKGVVLDELGVVQSNPEKWIWELWAENIWQGTGLARSYIGKEETIRGFTRQDLLEFKDVFYQPERMSLVVAGDIDINQAEGEIKEVAGSWAERKGEKRRDQIRQGGKVERPEGEQRTSYLIAGVKTVEFGQSESETLELLATILGGGMGSRLYERLVETGVSYQAEAFVEQVSDGGYLAVQATTPEKKLESVMEAIREEMARLKRGEFDKGEIERAKGYLGGRIKLDMESSYDWSDWYVEELRLRSGSMRGPEDKYERVRSLKKEELVKVAEKYMGKERLRQVVMGGEID